MKRKKIISLFLSLCLAANMVAFAAEDASNLEDEGQSSAAFAATTQDTTAPTISEIKVDGYEVTVSASDETALHAEAYSFNGGWTWQKSNSYVSSGSYTWVPGTICVRDAAGNVNYNRTNVSVLQDNTPQDNTLQDKTAPTISEIKVDGYKVTVSASDETALHAEAYSFNGGWTWQKSNSYVSSGSYTWIPGTICVRDAAGNINYNRTNVSVMQDTTAPTISEIKVDGYKVTVSASDETALHAEAYSFNGGWTWQKSNSYVSSGSYTWIPGTICVRDAAGNINYNRTNVSVPQDNTPQDKTAPTISEIKVDGYKVTVSASDETALHAEAYSFNGGWTWQKSNSYVSSGSYTWVPGTICVRDAAGNINYNRTNVSVMQDKTAPTISEIKVDGYKVTVSASDETALHAEAYSFNGGWTWQKSNSYVSSGSYTWVPGTICVRDAAGNINYNRTNVSVMQDKTAPTISEIKVDGYKVTVSASDETALHAEAYSFNGGWTWQKSNSYVSSGSYTWVPGTICVRDAAGNINYNRTNVSVPYNDSTLPVIDKIEVTPQEDAKEKTVTVTAHDDKELHAEAYSFNGGWTWQKSNSYTITESYTWVPGTICVRDAAGNINYNREKIEVICSSDSVAPKIESITVGGSTRYTLNKTVTVKATDEGSGVKEYSFDGGWTWQTSSVFVATEPKEWVPGTILVRDAEGNISYNREKIVADRVIQITDNKNGAGKVVTVLALDNGNGAPPVSYSFNGGTTWQTSNSYIVTGNTTWVPGTILAKDSLGNVNYNQDTIEVINGKTAIDVSSYQGYIDWEKVKASGVNYAIIRAVTWSGGQDGYWIIDPMFEQNVINAKNAGVKVGAYIYTYAFSDAEVNAEVAVFLNSANRLKSMGYSFDLPVFVDHEYPKLLTGVPDYNERTRLLKLEMDLLFQNGYYSGMYMSTSWAQKNVNAASLQAQGYDLWIADYRGYNGWGNSVVMWQYGSNGSVPGINGDVDMNYLYKDYSTIIDGSDNTGSGTVEPTLTVYDQKSGKNVTDSRLNILAAIVNNEVGGTALTGQDAAKLYKAQAIAAHSHLLYTYENQNTLPTLGLNYGGKYETIRQQIQEVENAVLTYGGKAANTVYTSSANGKTGYTNSSAEYWGTSLPYLVSVQSLYESYFGGEKYQGIVLTRTESQLKADLSKLVDPSYAAGIEPKNWIEITGRDEKTGYVTGIKIWGQEVSISKFYEEVTGAYSPAFEFSYANGVFTFTAWGNGHGVGMSQYGAMGMIGKGMMDWTQVLAHYYPGTTLQRI